MLISIVNTQIGEKDSKVKKKEVFSHSRIMCTAQMRLFFFSQNTQRLSWKSTNHHLLLLLIQLNFTKKNKVIKETHFKLFPNEKKKNFVLGNERKSRQDKKKSFLTINSIKILYIKKNVRRKLWKMLNVHFFSLFLLINLSFFA